MADHSCPSVTIIGLGRLGRSLARRFSECGITINQIFNRSKVQDSPVDVPIIDTWRDLLPMSDLYLICVSDDAIGAVCEALALVVPPSSFVVHVSGRVGLSPVQLYFKRSGSFYPLYTFGDDTTIDWTVVPILLDTHVRRDITLLDCLATVIGSRSYQINEAQRKKIHLAAVVANNFTTALIDWSYRYLSDNAIPPHILYPLIVRGIENIAHNAPCSIQTGPAKRGDNETIEAHIKLLEDPFMRAIYPMISHWINPQIKIDEDSTRNDFRAL